MHVVIVAANLCFEPVVGDAHPPRAGYARGRGRRRHGHPGSGPRRHPGVGMGARVDGGPGAVPGRRTGARRSQPSGHRALGERLDGPGAGGGAGAVGRRGPGRRLCRAHRGRGLERARRIAPRRRRGSRAPRDGPTRGVRGPAATAAARGIQTADGSHDYVGIVMAKSAEGDAVARFFAGDASEVIEQPAFWEIRARHRLLIPYDECPRNWGTRSMPTRSSMRCRRTTGAWWPPTMR